MLFDSVRHACNSHLDCHLVVTNHNDTYLYIFIVYNIMISLDVSHASQNWLKGQSPTIHWNIYIYNDYNYGFL